MSAELNNIVRTNPLSPAKVANALDDLQEQIDEGGGGGAGHTIEDEGTPLTTRTKLNFVGAGVTVTDDAGDDATVVTIPGGGGGGSNLFADLTDDPRDNAALEAELEALEDALNLKSDALITTRTLTGAHTLDATDLTAIDTGKNYIIESDGSGALTVPPNATQAFQNGSFIAIKGFTSVVEGSGVTVTPTSGSLVGLDPDVLLPLRKTATNAWELENSVDGAPGASSFTDLTDSPASYSGQANKVVSVKADESGLEFTTPSGGSGSDASTTVKGVVEIATAAEITAGTTNGATGAPLAVNPNQLVSATPTVTGLKISSATAGAGTRRVLLIDDTGAANSNVDLQFDVASKQLRIGGTFLVEVPSGTASGAALVKFLANQASALRFGDGTTDWTEFISTTGNEHFRIKKRVQYNQGQDFVTWIIQYTGTTSATNGGTTTQASLAIPSGHSANAVLDVLMSASDGTTVGGQVRGTFKNVSGTTSRTGHVQSIQAEGARTDSVALTANDTNDRIDIVFTNDASAGKAFKYSYELKVQLSAFPV